MPNQLPQLEVEDFLAEIEATFGPVRLGDGTSLHQADALDDYSPPDVVAAASAITRAGVDRGALGGDAVVYAFHFTDALEGYVMSRYALLSPEQCRTIARFLRFAASHDEWFDAPIATEALERYWGKYA